VALAPGTRLGAYEIQSLIGSGGMGEVYRARDSRLNRDVAIKVLPSEVAADRDRLARFEREAQVLASLNHPNIANIYGVDDSSGTPALVMELVEGPTLADRIAKGPIPLDEALPIATQIAEALAAAHEQGIIHRDLKPANIKVRADGTVKLLDFGLAKAFDPVASAAGNATMSPTLSMRATQAGLILGTAAYMSPEQATGKPADKRSDLWAFGVVLLEMLTGTPVFAGETTSHVLASVLKDEPNWARLPAGTPAPIRRLLGRCLEKDHARRLDSAAAARLDLDEALTASDASLVASWPPLWRWIVPAAIGVVLGAGMVAGARWREKPTLPSANVSRSSMTLPDGQDFTNAGRQVVALSPDGTQLVYVANSRLYLRALSDLEARPIPIGGFDDRIAVINPVGLELLILAPNRRFDNVA
jgi:serine/threonine-protein kinase